MAKRRGAWPANHMCEVFGVSRSGCNAWLVRPRTLGGLDDEVLGAQVRRSLIDGDRTDGARQVWRDVSNSE